MTTQELNFILNEKNIALSQNPGIVTLDFLRSKEKLTGTKEGCREGDCGACTILLGELSAGKVHYKPVVSCLLPIGELDGKHVVTIEGLNREKLNLIQQSIMNEGATQCGFCTPGIVISFTGFLLNNKNPTIFEAVNSIGGNICRCTGYSSLKRVAEDIVEICSKKINKNDDRVKSLINLGVLPEYFLTIPGRLKKILQKQTPRSVRTSNKSMIVAGGTDLFVQKPDEVLEKNIIFLSKDENLKNIQDTKNFINIGSAVTVEGLKNSSVIKKHFPLLINHLDLISSSQIRNQATIGGNIMNASPIGDLSIILLGLNSELNLLSNKKMRKVLLKDFFLGYKKLNIKGAEIIGCISIPKVKHRIFNFEKVSRRKYLDIASANTAMSIKMEKNIVDEIYISAGGVAPVPLFLKETSDFLTGKSLDTASIRSSLQIMLNEISPISDVRGSADYKKLLLHQLIIAHYIKLFPEKFKMEDLL